MRTIKPWLLFGVLVIALAILYYFFTMALVSAI